ncbi:sigma-54-dependent Fis family transcriptional regulator [Massilia forsythiae]|uniref:Sigma-54-dependent Fis family transcriptional regulator n=1 Tax=Massilia forsythiae TaxID=2728020 RepID=A0A7Z2W0C0_9BURK|nr:sigma-54 dependent transcriptional regulator [Massilia forsythiae]QJE02601.1 sigma-54-dependent Fis family transcriptional regulator [Massilia forsythiae]
MKQVLCINLGNTGTADSLADAMDGWDVHPVSNLADARRLLRRAGHAVGFVLYPAHAMDRAELAVFLREHADVQWIGIVEPREIENESARQFVIEHLYDYHTTPIDHVRLAYTLGHAHGWARLRQKHADASSNGKADASPLVGGSEAMLRLRAQVGRVARVAAPVLIWGESGSGKELAAQTIHAQSERAAGPFVPINCGAIAPNLIQSELFGHERGAFTGATRAKVGLIESAHGGTLFLDEIGDLPKDLQVNLLRFLQEKTIFRVGGTRAIHVDVRVVAASHVQLHQAVAANRFREDLYYRLAVLPVNVPALRERRDDIVTLAEHFFRLYAAEKSPRLQGFSREALDAVLDHAWPGNIRELMNRVRRAMVMADGRLIMPEDLGLGLGAEGATRAATALDDARERNERSSLRESLDRSGQNVSMAARQLGISRTTMYRMLNKYSMRV